MIAPHDHDGCVRMRGVQDLDTLHLCPDQGNAVMPLCPCQVPGYVGDCSRNECLVRSLTARAEKAEGAMTALYEEVARLRAALLAIEHLVIAGCNTGEVVARVEEVLGKPGDPRRPTSAKNTEGE